MKQRYNIKITDIQLTILSDEPEDFVYAIVSQLDERVGELSVKNRHCSRLDAALLCALDSMGEKAKADKKIKNLEAQISLYEATNKRLREELDALRSSSAPIAPDVKETPAEEPAEEEVPAEAEVIEEPKEVLPEKEPEVTAKKEEVRQLSIDDIPTEAEPTPQKEEQPPLHDDKLKQIEQLLRRRSESGTTSSSAETKKEEAPAPKESASVTRDEKLRQIEDLLRKNGSAKSLSEVLHNAIGN